MPALQGFIVEWPFATPTMGFWKSPSVKPTARNIARLGERATPAVMIWERLLSFVTRLSFLDCRATKLQRRLCPRLALMIAIGCSCGTASTNRNLSAHVGTSDHNRGTTSNLVGAMIGRSDGLSPPTDIDSSRLSRPFACRIHEGNHFGLHERNGTRNVLMLGFARLIHWPMGVRPLSTLG